MVKREDMFIRSLGGTLMWENTPLIYFNIKDGKLIDYKRCLSSNKYYPYELAKLGINYMSFNKFFRERVVLDGSQDIMEYLEAMDMKKYDFETLVKKNHGRNYLDCYWIKDMID